MMDSREELSSSYELKRNISLIDESDATNLVSDATRFSPRFNAQNGQARESRHVQGMTHQELVAIHLLKSNCTKSHDSM